MSDIIVGSVGVQLVPSAKDFAPKTRALTQGLTAEVRLDADTAAAEAKLDEAAHDRDSRIEANADTARAEEKLDRAARTRKAKILPDVSGFSALTTGLLSLGPALVPITAATGGLVASLGAPLAAGAGGATLYGLIAGKAVKDTEKQSKAIEQLHKKVVAAQQAVERASTPSGKKSALARLADDTKAYDDALAKLNPQQREFLKAQDHLGDAFTKLERSAGPVIFDPLTKGMNALATLLPKVEPVLDPVSKSIGGLLDEVERSARDGAVSDFLHFTSELAGPTITGAGHVLGNIAVGFGAIGSKFLPVSKSVGHGLEDWSEGFAKIGSSKGLSDFVGYVEREGPQVAKTLGDVGSAVGHVAKAVAPIGDIGLKAIDGLANGISKIPTGVLTVAAGSLAAIAVSMKGIKLANSGLSLLGKIPGIGSKLTGPGTLLGGAAGKGVVPVYVTNEGFGGGAGGGVLGGGSKLLKAIPLIGAGIEAIHLGLQSQKRDDANMAKFQTDAKKALIGAIVDGWHDAVKTQKSTKDLLLGPTNAGNGKSLKVPVTAELTWDKALLAGYSDQLKKLPKKVQTAILTPGAVTSLGDVRKLAKQYDLTPKQVQTLIKLMGTAQASSDLIRLQRQIGGLHDKTVTITVRQRAVPLAATSVLVPGATIGGSPRLIGGAEVDGLGFAPRVDSGLTVTPRLATGVGSGSGGVLGPSLQSLVRHLQHEINQAGKRSRGSGKKGAAERKAAAARKKRLEKRLDRLKDQQSVIKGFSLSGILPTIEPKNSVTAGTRSALNQFQRDLVKAGGKWTGGMQDQAHSLLATTLQIDKLTHKLDGTDGLTGHVDGLKDKLAAAQGVVSSLKDTMAQLGSTLSSSFGPSLFNLTDAGGNKHITGASDLLSGLNSSTGNATGFLNAISQLAGEGLNTTTLGILANSSDLSSATNLASTLTPSDIATINAAQTENTSALNELAKQIPTLIYGADLTSAQANVSALATQAQAVQNQINDLTAIANQLVKAIKSDAAHPHATQAQAKRTNELLAEISKELKAQPVKNGKATSAALNKTAAAGKRRAAHR